MILRSSRSGGEKKSGHHRHSKAKKMRRGDAKKSSANKKSKSKLSMSDMALEQQTMGDGLTSKQRRKVVSKAIISSTEDSDDSDKEKKLHIDDRLSRLQQRF